MRGSKVKQIRRDCLFAIGDSRIVSYEDKVVKQNKFYTGRLNPDGSKVLDLNGKPETATFPSVTRFLSNKCPRKIYKILKKGAKNKHVSSHSKAIPTQKQRAPLAIPTSAPTKAVESESFPES